MTKYALKFVFKLAFLLSSFVATNGTAVAQTVRVRTGEHENFTRIVIDFTKRPNWQVGQVNQHYELWSENTDIAFDLSDSFRRLHGKRISSITDLGNGRLAVELICQCSLSVLPLSNEGLIIDVQDGPPSVGNPWVAPLIEKIKTKENPAPDRNYDVLPLILPTSIEQTAIGQFIEKVPLVSSKIKNERVYELRKKILEQTTRAASQGLISIDDENFKKLDRLDEPPSEDLAGIIEQISVAAKSSDANVKIETQYDRDNSTIYLDEKDNCIDSVSVDIGSWFSDRNIIESLGEAKVNLIDVRGRVDPDAYNILARMLLYLSFGAEARSILSDGPPNIPQKNLLLELANILDNRQENMGDLLRAQVGCDTSGALWGLLSATNKIELDAVNIPAVVRSFSNLPSHLRRHFGLRVAEKLLNADEREAAMQIRNAMKRGGMSYSELIMLEARLDQTEEQRAEVNTQLTDVATSGGTQVAEALAQLIQNQISEKMKIQSGVIEFAEALIFEINDETHASSLIESVIQAYDYEFRFDDALFKIDDFVRQGVLGLEASRDLKGEILSNLTQNADDETFLKTAIREAMNKKIEGTTRLEMARRMLKLGLSEPTRIVLGVDGKIPNIDERYILAEIAILEGRVSVAMSYLAGLETDRANVLRLKAQNNVDKDLFQNKRAPNKAGLSEAIVTEVINQGVLTKNRELLSVARAKRNEFLTLLGRPIE